MDETLKAAVERELRELWLNLRDDGHTTEPAASCISFAFRCGLLTAREAELWQFRIGSCPGHDDEGGRSWCAYCGDMPKSKNSG